MQVNPYLAFDGKCRDAFEFYAGLLGAKIMMIMTHGESPMADQTPPAWRDKVIHATLDVGGTLLMGSDAPPEHFEKAKGMSVTLSIDAPAEAERIFKVLSDGGAVGMPLQETFWALRFGTVVDRYGTPWMINCSRPM